MKKIFFSLFTALALLNIATTTNATINATPLVDAAWVKGNIANHDVVFLDLRGSPPAFQAGHIPGAVLTSYNGDKWRVNKGEIKGMLPTVAHLEALIGRLGIGNTSHVVLVPGGFSSAEMGVATRIYWTFKVMGHDAVSILNGGISAYAADKNNPLEKGRSQPKAKTFKAAFRPELLATDTDVKKALAGNGTQLLDSRPNDQYLGINKSGSVTRPGSIPGAINLPGRWTTVNDGGTFRAGDVLNKLYAAAKAPTQGDTITYCNTGHWASIGWFVNSELIGNKKTKLYDGSLAEWSRIKDAKMEQRVKLN